MVYRSGGQAKCVYNIQNRHTLVDAPQIESKTLPELQAYPSNKSERFEAVSASSWWDQGYGRQKMTMSYAGWTARGVTRSARRCVLKSSDPRGQTPRSGDDQ